MVCLRRMLQQTMDKHPTDPGMLLIKPSLTTTVGRQRTWLTDGTTTPVSSVADNFDGVECHWLALQLPYEVKPTLVTLRARNDPHVPTEVPAKGRIYGSKDGATWDQIKSYDIRTEVSTLQASTDNAPISITLTTNEYYTHLLLTVDERYGGAFNPPSWTAAGELRYFGTARRPQNWWRITSSSDGTKLAASVYKGNIWTSIDSGATWTSRASTQCGMASRPRVTAPSSPLLSKVETSGRRRTLERLGHPGQARKTGGQSRRRVTAPSSPPLSTMETSGRRRTLERRGPCVSWNRANLDKYRVVKSRHQACRCCLQQWKHLDLQCSITTTISSTSTAAALVLLRRSSCEVWFRNWERITLSP